MAAEPQPETTLNPEDGSLPYAYFNPETEGKLTWVCNKDSEGKITSVFCFDHGTHKDRQVRYLATEEEAQYMRDELIKAGWDKFVPPEITFNYPGEKEGKKLNRKQKRYLKKKLKRAQSRNPFRGSDLEVAATSVDGDTE
jgi:hypothetical protein